MFAIGHLLAHATALNPEAAFITSESQTATFREIALRASALAQALSVRELNGTRVAIAYPNGADYVAALFGVLAAGCVAVPIHDNYSDPERLQILESARPSALVTNPGQHWIPAGLPVVQPGDHSEAGFIPAVSASSTDPAIVLFTSGSTGRPKGVVLSHGNIVSNAILSAQTLQLGASDRVLTAVPMSHAYGQNRGLMAPLAARATVIVDPAGSLLSLLQMLEKSAATVLISVPNVYAVLAAKTVTGVSSLRVALSGAAPLPPAIQVKFTKKTGVPLLVAYGMTEASPVITSQRLDMPINPGSVGYPLPGLDVQLRDEDGLSLGTGNEGRLFVRGHNIMLGYLDDPEGTADIVRNGWLDTGDIARLGDDGEVTILGRVSGMAKRNGFRVFPAEVQSAIAEHPSIEDVVVRVIKNPISGDDLVAEIVIKENEQGNIFEIQKYLSQILAPYKRPSSIKLVDAIVTAASGKPKL